MRTLDERLNRLESGIAEMEARFLAIRSENTRLRSADLDVEPAPSPQSGAEDRPSQAAIGGRPLRLAVLEAERHDLRSRIRTLIEIL